MPFPDLPRSGRAAPAGWGSPSQDALPVELLSARTDIKSVGQNPDWTRITGTDRPWLHSCGLQGPVKLRIRLATEPCDTRAWKVTLYFHTSEYPQPPARFDVRLQDQIVLSHVDLHGGSTNAVAKEFVVNASDILTVEMLPCGGTQPVLDGLQIRAE